MKIAVTGHISGIGKAISEYFSTGNEVIGFSRTNGYDISVSEIRKKICNEIKDSDIFVNNAYHNYDDSQLLLLQDVFELWRGDTTKKIINISSRWTNATNRYSTSKKAQDEFCNQHIFNYPAIINLKPGLIDTPRVANQNGKKQSVSALIEILDFILKNTDYGIRSITFGYY